MTDNFKLQDIPFIKSDYLFPITGNTGSEGEYIVQITGHLGPEE
jgi:hypothetical protein